MRHCCRLFGGRFLPGQQSNGRFKDSSLLTTGGELSWLGYSTPLMTPPGRRNTTQGGNNCTDLILGE